MFRVINKIEKMYDVNVMPFFEGEINNCEHISEENKKLIESIFDREKFNGEENKKVSVSFLEHGHLINMLYIGIGKRNEFTENKYREILFSNFLNLKGDILISSGDSLLSNAKILTEIVYNVNYSFDRYKKEKDKKINVDLFEISLENNDENIVLNEVTNIVRELINEPANVITPETLSLKAESLGKEYGVETEIYDEYRVSELGMEGFLSVGRAGANRPKLIVMRYFGNPENGKNICGLIGKGLTYDTGGLSLKPTDSMLEMKSDMGGAATVIGAICALAKMKVKKNVVAVVAACENSIGSKAYRPGDIINTMLGKTIEITNTDAEGRITLVDAITYAIKEEKVTEIIDVATLTGGVVVALGSEATGIFSNDEGMYRNFQVASEMWGEYYWRLPLYKEYAKLIKSDVADLKNSAGRWASSITAAKFLEEFIENTPWIHLDIAGTAYLDKPGKWTKKGATGVAVKTIYSYLKK